MPADDPDPPRKFYEFKPNEFEPVNPLVNAPQPIPPIDVHNLLRQANSAKPGGVAQPSPSAQPNEVHALLRLNEVRAKIAGLNELKPMEQRPSRRNRDFWFLVISGNLLLVLIAVQAGITSPIVFAPAIAGIGMLTFSLYWVMYHIMEDY
jgi:hypothetical protein